MVAFAGRLRAPFYRYWLSGFLSDVATGIRLAASPLLAAEVNPLAAAVAAVTTVQGLPWLLFGGGAGGIVDRVDPPPADSDGGYRPRGTAPGWRSFT